MDHHTLNVDYADTSTVGGNHGGNQQQNSGHGYNNQHGGRRDYDNRIVHHQQQQQQQHQRPSHFPSSPTDTMIVRNLDLNSTEDSIRTAFDYITKKTIVDIRLAKDRMV